MTLQEALAKPDGAEFYALESFELVSQSLPRTSANGKIYSILNLKAGSKTAALFLWDAAAIKVPDNVEFLKGTFIRNDYNGQKNIRCENLTMPEGSKPFGDKEIKGVAGVASIAEILTSGKRGVDWLSKQGIDSEPILAAAFAAAATAKMKGHPDN